MFPATPDSMANVTFHQLRTEGAFLVSAVRINGMTQFVRINSIAGRQCVVQVADWGHQVPMLEPSTIHVAVESDGFHVGIGKGQTAKLYLGDHLPSLVTDSLPGNLSEFNYYGYRWPLPPYQ